MKYHKLVRDKIVDHIQQKGKTVVAHTASDAEYWQKLKEKLVEEVEEFLTDESPEELADILEVIDAIMAYKKFASHEMVQLKEVKAKERGAFKKRHILDEVTS